MLHVNGPPREWWTVGYRMHHVSYPEFIFVVTTASEIV